MQYLGEIISLGVAVSWTATALCAEVASKRMGSMGLNVVRMLLSLIMLSITLWCFTGYPYPAFADSQTWLWLSLSGFIGYVLGDFCLFNSYIIIGSRFGQLFMTLAPLAAALSGWVILGESLSLKAWLGMLVTLFGIGLSVFSKTPMSEAKEDANHAHITHPSHLTLKLPLKGVLFGIGAGVGQGVGLVLSKVGMNHYTAAIPAGEEQVLALMPFASTFIRAVTGAIGFILWMGLRHELHTLNGAVRDRKGMGAALGATITGPFIGVSFSLMAVQYTEAGIASTLMALTPIFIILPAYYLFHQKATTREVIGAIISVAGVSLFFL